LTALSLNFTLLIINDYFNLSSTTDIKIGIKAVEVFGKTEDFQQFTKTCKNLALDEEICGNISNIKKAGDFLIGFICLDVTVLVIYSICNLFQYYLAHSLISKKFTQEERTKRRCCFKLSFYLRLVFWMHPVVVNLACGLWIKISNVEKFSSKIRIKAGVALLILQCFLSLLIVAIFLWEISSSRRRSARMKRAKEIIEKKNELKHFPIKMDSMEIPNEEKTFDFELKV
jgi:hypothetical protein